MAAILAIVTALQLKKKTRELADIKTKSIAARLLFITAEILWLIMVSLFFPIGRFLGPPEIGMTYTFWSVNFLFLSIPLHTVGFGVIGGFLSAVLSLIGTGAASYYSKPRSTKTTTEKELDPPKKKETSSTESTIKFCPECGSELKPPLPKFCGDCGYELEKG